VRGSGKKQVTERGGVVTVATGAMRYEHGNEMLKFLPTLISQVPKRRGTGTIAATRTQPL